MSDASLPGASPARSASGFRRWRNSLAASRAFQSWASRLPLLRVLARREGEALFDLVAGFVHSQVLCALVELRILHELKERDLDAATLARRAGIPAGRMHVLLQAGAALSLLRSLSGGDYTLTTRGAALLGVPGLEGMILHHRVLYRDLEDAAAFFRGEDETELASFWPYVFGAGGAADAGVAERYSQLMADSQALVAEETLRTVSFADTRCLLDVGGGSGEFLCAAAEAYPDLTGTLFDLPEVAVAAERRFASRGLSNRLSIRPGSFRAQDLPKGADTVTLVRVLYDHTDDTVTALLGRIHAALPAGGRLVISEPMSGGMRPTRAGDAYFAIYTMAMGTGKTRSPAEIGALLERTGFSTVQHRSTRRPFVTSVVEARRL